MSHKLSKNAGRAKRRRGKSGPNYIQLYRYVTDSPAYISLSLAARAALVEVNLGYNGSNNGRIVLSVRTLAERMGGCHRDTAMRSLQELVDKGFIEHRVKGAFSVKFRRATEWRLNDRRCDVTGVEQSQAFLKWSAAEPEARAVPTAAEARADTRPWAILGMSRRTWYRRGKPETIGTGTNSRSQKLGPYGPKNQDTKCQTGTPSRSQKLGHSGTNYGPKNQDTSISTTAMVVDAAPVAAHNDTPGITEAVPVDDWHRNARLPSERLNGVDDLLGIPDFLRRY